MPPRRKKVASAASSSSSTPAVPTGVGFDNVLHIGDHQVNDIFAANELGIDCLWFNNNNAQWEQNFKKPDEFSSWHDLTNIISNKYER